MPKYGILVCITTLNISMLPNAIILLHSFRFLHVIYTFCHICSHTYVGTISKAATLSRLLIKYGCLGYVSMVNVKI